MRKLFVAAVTTAALFSGTLSSPAVASEVPPPVPTLAAASETLLATLFTSADFNAVQAEFDPTIAVVQMSPLDLARHLLAEAESFRTNPPAATGDAGTDLYVRQLLNVLQTPDVAAQMDYARARLADATYVAQLLAGDPSAGVPIAISDPFGASAQGLPTLKIVRRIVMGVGIAVGTGFAVAICGAVVVCAVGAAVAGAFAFTNNALDAAQDIQDLQETANANDGTTVIYQLICQPGNCASNTLGFNNNMSATQVDQSFVIVTPTGSFDVPQTNTSQFPFYCETSLSGQRTCQKYGTFNLASEPRLSCAVAVGARVRFYWPNGTSSFDSAVTYHAGTRAATC